GSNGILIAPGLGAAAGARIDVVLDNVHSQHTRVGLAVINNGRVTINRSVLSGNSVAGIFVSGPLAPTEVNVSNSVIHSRGTGVQNAGGTVTIRLANNDITLNGTAISGATQSFTNNRIQGNGTLGTAPTPIGSTSNPTGLQ